MNRDKIKELWRNYVNKHNLEFMDGFPKNIIFDFVEYVLNTVNEEAR